MQSLRSPRHHPLALLQALISKRPAPISIRLTATELARLKDACEHAGCTVNMYVRSALDQAMIGDEKQMRRFGCTARLPPGAYCRLCGGRHP
jgi:hypothetical protein